jgi:hypothetical protein
MGIVEHLACGYVVNSATALVRNEPSRSILPTPTCNRAPSLPALSCLLECLSKWARSIFRGDRLGNHRLGAHVAYCPRREPNLFV